MGLIAQCFFFLISIWSTIRFLRYLILRISQINQLHRSNIGQSPLDLPGNAHVKGFVFIHIHVMETSEHHSNHMFRVNYPGWTKHAGIWSLSNPTEGNGLSKRWLVGFQSLYHLISCVQSSFILGSIIWFVHKMRRKAKILLWGSWVTSL